MKLINFCKNLIRPNMIKPIFYKNENKIKNINVVFNKKLNFGKKNKNKIFYVIKKNYAPNGFFSLITFVMEHLLYAKKKSYIPIVDMENFLNPYNEKEKINNSFNCWEYYFKQISPFKLNEIYKSENVIFSSNDRFTSLNLSQSKEFTKIFKKNIVIEKKIIEEAKKIKNYFFNKKDRVLGIRLSGLLQRIVTNHPLPVSNEEALNISIKIFEKEKCNKLFIITEDIDQLNLFKKYFKEKLVYLNVPRSKCNFYGSHNIEYENYYRDKHRFKLGKECIINSILFSDFDVLLFRSSNIISFSSLFRNKKQKRFEIVTENNSKKIIYARWKWYLKTHMPFIFGKLKYKVIKRD